MNNTTSNNEKTAGIINALECEIEELDAKIAPLTFIRTGITNNHNETLVRDTDAEVQSISAEIEELEERIAPVTSLIRKPIGNHNETLVRDVS